MIWEMGQQPGCGRSINLYLARAARVPPLRRRRMTCGSLVQRGRAISRGAAADAGGDHLQIAHEIGTPTSGGEYVP